MGGLVGVDFGSKTAGTTVLAHLSDDGEVRLFASKKGSDADQFLEELIEDIQPNAVGIDAPLSLPAVYRHVGGYDDFHYRVCDRLAGAMSPLFLGGLTARAMRLHFIWQEMPVFEVYPKLLAQHLGLDMKRYKKDGAYLADAQQVWMAAWNQKVRLERDVQNWHELDALLALMSTERIIHGKAVEMGEEAEGIIYF